MYRPAARIDPKELRPSRRWFIPAGVIATLSLVIGFAGVVWFSLGIIETTKIDQRFRPGQTVTVTIESGKRTAIYVPEDARLASGPRCTVLDRSGRHLPIREPGSTTTMSTGDETWLEIFIVGAPVEPGPHQMTCESATTVDFATGGHLEVGETFGRLGLVAIVPVVGIATAVIMAVVVGVKRGRHRKRLIAERYGPPPPGPYGLG